MPNSPFVRELINEVLQDHGAVDRIQFSVVCGMEWLANMLSHPGTFFAEVMEAKTEVPALAEMDLKNFVPDHATQILPVEQIIP